MITDTKDLLQESREKLLAMINTIDAYCETLNTKIKDSSGVYRREFWHDESTIAAVGEGQKNHNVIVEANQFDVDLLILRGAVKVEFSDGNTVLIDKHNKHLFIPKYTSFKMIGLGEQNAIIQRTEL